MATSHLSLTADYEQAARELLPEPVFAYFAGGAGGEETLRDNVEAFRRVSLVPRHLRGGPGGSAATELLGQRYPSPLIVAPMAYQKLLHPVGEVGMAMAATSQDCIMVLSSLASQAMEEVRAAGPSCSWFQLYMQPDREATLQLVRRAEACGFAALVVTVDAPLNGVRDSEIRTGFRLPAGITAVNLPAPTQRPRTALPEGASMVFDHGMSQAPTWKDIAWLRRATRLHLILKGIVSPDDAELAAQAGADAIIVSNHGGRVLDGTIASLDALRNIVPRVDGRLPLLMDGGVRRGTDVLKAMALGASAVLVGRPVAYGLAATGPKGAAHVLRLLRDEFEIAMALSGCRTVADIGRQLIASR